MTPSRGRAAARPWLAVLLLGVLLAQGTTLLLRTGVAYDEPVFITAGHWYVTRGLGFTIREHPPLSDYLSGVLVASLGPITPRAQGAEDQEIGAALYSQNFLFRNRIHPTTILRTARLPSLLLTFLLGLLLWRWGSVTAGAVSGLAALFFCAFEPTLLAHGALVTKDISVTVFMAAALAAWCRYLVTKRRAWALAAGTAAGLALSCKMTALGLFPVIGLTLIWPPAIKNRKDAARAAKDLGITLAAAAAVVIIVYTPGNIHMFFDSLTYVIGFAAEATPSFLLGKTHPEGHRLYFPISLMLKAPLPLLILSALAFADPRLRKDHPHTVRVCGLAVLVVMAASLKSHHQHGIRYILPVFAPLALMAGLAAGKLWESGKKKRLAAAAAFLWTGMSVLSNFPHHLSYLNELAGPNTRGYSVLGDSSLDWGQSLPELRDFLADNPGGLILSYFGQDCPQVYGIVGQEAFSTPGLCSGHSSPLPVDTGREWLVVSATKWQGFYERATPVWSWLWEKEPYTVLGNSLLVYDITRDAAAHLSLAEMYDRAGLRAFAKRERARARRIDG